MSELTGKGEKFLKAVERTGMFTPEVLEKLDAEAKAELVGLECMSEKWRHATEARRGFRMINKVLKLGAKLEPYYMNPGDDKILEEWIVEQFGGDREILKHISHEFVG